MSLKAAPYASEWNFGAWSAASAARFYDNVAAFESRRIAYTGWQCVLRTTTALKSRPPQELR